MYRFFLFICVCIIFWIRGISMTLAHPLDVSNTTLTLYDKTIVWVTYIHPVELDRILVMSGGMSPTSITLESYYSLTGILTQYLDETFTVTSSWLDCPMGSFDFQEWLMIDEVYGRGFPISYVFTCESTLIDPVVTITFLNEVPLQTNRLYVYTNRDWKFERSNYSVLNAKKSTQILLWEKNLVKLSDIDNDGLSDEDEKLYGTDLSKMDTDDDGYNDNYEIQSSWNPLSADLSPGQLPYSKEQQELLNTTSTPTSRGANDLSQDSNVWWGIYFQKILRDIRIYIDNSSEGGYLWVLLLSVGALGFFHALGPGHSKGILIAQIIDDRMTYLKSIVYCLLFTAIHLIDIIIVVLITKLFFDIVDPSVYLSRITQISAILLVGIGWYLLFVAMRRFHNPTPVDTKENLIQKKNYIIMAIIAGLAPCAFWWSIFLMLIAIGKMSLAPPLLLSLWLGIFLCLWLIATVTWFLKEKIYSFSPKIGQIAPLISSFGIFCIWLVLLLKNF